MKLNILIVDDDKTLLSALKTVLVKENNVTICNDGKKAIELCQNKKFDLIITDLMMPGANGLEVLTESRKIDPDSLVVLITGFASLEKAQRFVTHLFTTLDHENGGEVAQNLSRMYAYIINETEGVKGTKDTEKLNAIIKILGNIRAGWAGLRDSGVSGTKKAPQAATETAAADGFVVTA